MAYETYVILNYTKSQFLLDLILNGHVVMIQCESNETLPIVSQNVTVNMIDGLILFLSCTNHY